MHTKADSSTRAATTDSDVADTAALTTSEVGPVPQKMADQAAMFANRLVKRDKHLRKWARRVDVDAYRVYDRDIPEIPLIVERYGTYLAGSLFERPYEKDEAEEDAWLDAMIDAASGALDVPRENIFIKRRRRQRGLAQYEKMDQAGVTTTVREHGTLFTVNLSDWLDTGLFLDHRETRARVRAEAAGKRILNLFSYTGSFSVQAALGGAREVDSLDLSNTWLDIARENFRLNGLETIRLDAREYAEERGPAARSKNGSAAGFENPATAPLNRLIRGDALRFMAHAREDGLLWDTIILDPPSFSNSSGMDGTLDVRRDAVPLLEAALALLEPGGPGTAPGVLWFSTNVKRFTFPLEAFPGYRIEDLSRATLDPDVEAKTPRRVWRICRRD